VAKLSAHGTELARATTIRLIESSLEPGETYSVRTERTLMSDGKVLLKQTFLDESGKVKHTAGWKVTGQIKKEQFKDKDLATEMWLQIYRTKGWDVVDSRGK
jgi:hypothetical protein